MSFAMSQSLAGRVACAIATGVLACLIATGPALAMGGSSATTTGTGAIGTPQGGTPAPTTAPTTTAPVTPPTTGLPSLGRSGTPFTRSLAKPPSRRAKHRISALEIVLLALAALLALVLAAWAAARRRSHDPHWWLALRHSFAEAGFRASETWAEFTDWVRLGH